MSRDAGRSRLVGRSLEVLVGNQHPGGAFPAAPEYDTYRYCWVRDGAFIANALDRFGFHHEADRFHRWTAETILRHRHKVEAMEKAVGNGPPSDDAVLHTRFTLDGTESRRAWGNFQLDGYGFWLVGLVRHRKLSGAEMSSCHDAVELVARYLTMAWELPCYDCWEEYPHRRHPTTLAAVAAGLQAADRLLGGGSGARTAERILAEIADRGTRNGALVKLLDEPVSPVSASRSMTEGPAAVAGHERIGKSLPADAVDAGALLVLGDFGPFKPDDGIVNATLGRIEADLVVDGGVHRYLDDEYYGGGLWVLLSGALAAVQARRGRLTRSAEIIRWIETQADSADHLPEQVGTVLRNPDHRRPWIDRWGPVGSPLLWSHAMYLIAVDETWPGRFGSRPG